MILACNSIKKSYGTTDILNNINFNINEKDKVALIGVNGAGKSTLFKIIIGEETQDTGDVILQKNAKIGYFSQILDINEEQTLFSELLVLFAEIRAKEEKLREMEKLMENCGLDELDKLADEHHKISTYFIENNCLDYNSRIKGVLKGLGFIQAEFDKQIKYLSGGQKTRVALAKILLKEPDILLLDEPTNHLDIKSIEWLESFLKGYTKAIFIISHDRYFLDKIVTKIVEIENTKATVYNGGYSDYSQKKQALRESMIKSYLNQQKDIKNQEEVIKKLKSFNREKSVKRAESRMKALDRMEKIDKPENLPSKMRLNLSPKKESGNDVVYLENIEKSFTEKLLSNITIDVKKGDKIALIGANGVGKTTLIKILMGNIEPDAGKVKIGAGVSVGYYDQEQENLDLNKSIFDEIAYTYPKLRNEDIRNALAVFVFTGDDVFKKINTLSGGEKGRVALAKVMLSNANFLILDEPTNHLDMVSKEILENALINYTGTYLYISHDRFFINKTANKIIDLTKNKANSYVGNYDYYLEKTAEVTQNNTKEIEESITKLDWKAQKEIQAENKRKEREVKQIEKQIEILEDKIKEAEHSLSLEEVYTDAGKTREVFAQKISNETELASLYELWEKIM